MEKTQVFEKFFDALERNEEISGLTAAKFQDRGAAIVEDPENPGWYIFAVERHRAICGATYTQGLGMSAMETYRQKISFNPETRALVEMEDEHVGYDIDFGALAEEQFPYLFSLGVFKKESWEEKRRVVDSTTNIELETSSFAEACNEFREFIEGWDIEHEFLDLEISDEEKGNMESKFKEEMVQLLIGDLEAKWNDPEILDEDAEMLTDTK